MKVIRFNRSMSPHQVGAQLVVPPEVAARLVSTGEATIIGDFPAVKPAAPSQPPKRIRRLDGRLLAQTYLNKRG